MPNLRAFVWDETVKPLTEAWHDTLLRGFGATPETANTAVLAEKIRDDAGNKPTRILIIVSGFEDWRQGVSAFGAALRANPHLHVHFLGLERHAVPPLKILQDCSAAPSRNGLR